MANLSAERYIKQVGNPAGAASIQVGIDGAASKIYEGALVSLLTATGMAVRGGTASSSHVMGVASATVDNSAGADGALSINLLQGAFWFGNSSAGDAITEIEVGKIVYVVDDQTVSKTSNSNARPIAGICLSVDPTDGVLVYISAAMNEALEADQSDLAADLASVAATLGANMIGYQDAGGFTAADDVDEALDEHYQHAKSIQKQVNIPLTSSIDIATGALLAVFANGVSTTPGTQFTDSKTAAVRWNNDAAPGAIAVNVAMPQDLDDTADVVFHALVSKVGATVGDATSLTVGAFEHIVGALHDADADFGGATSAVVGNAASKTVTEVTLTLALANVNPTPSSMCFTIKPTAGLLGTDDFLLHSAWLEYKGKLLTT